VRFDNEHDEDEVRTAISRHAISPLFLLPKDST